MISAAALFLIACTVGVCSGHAGHDHSALVEPIFKEHEIVPDVLDVAPTQELVISYAHDVDVSLGEVLTPTQVKDVPIVVEWPAEPTEYYTLIMTDPDAPSRKTPEAREWRHWTVVNIPGNNVTAGETLAEYVGAGPPSGSGLHRYVFLVYKQTQKHAFGEQILTNKNSNRAHFSTIAFAAKHSLGNPVAGNFFQAEWDSYVPTLYAQFE